MKVSNVLVSVATVALLSQSVMGWTNEDHEIFDIVSALQTAEGKDTTFYTFLNVTQAASEKDISKAYRKRSLELHPDKNPDVKNVADRFARLGTIAGILRDGEKRKRYDHFHDNGVPKWRGSGYYYSRYRPGFGFVVACLTAFSCLIQWIFLKLSYRAQCMKIANACEQALEHAWGPSKKPLAGRKRLQVQTGPGPGIPALGGDGSLSSQGQKLNLICEGNKVYVVNPDGSETLFDDKFAVPPKATEIWVAAVLIHYYQRITGTLPEQIELAAPVFEPQGTVIPAAKKGRVVVEEAAPRKPKGPAKGIEGLGKIGGRRRKALPKKPEA